MYDGDRLAILRIRLRPMATCCAGDWNSRKRRRKSCGSNSCGNSLRYDGQRGQRQSFGSGSGPLSCSMDAAISGTANMGIERHLRALGRRRLPLRRRPVALAHTLPGRLRLHGHRAPGSYVVETDGAIDSDGMPAYAASSDSFQVDFGAGVTLDPPAPPRVTAQTSGSLDQPLGHLAKQQPQCRPVPVRHRHDTRRA